MLLGVTSCYVSLYIPTNFVVPFLQLRIKVLFDFHAEISFHFRPQNDVQNKIVLVYAGALASYTVTVCCHDGKV